MPSMTILTGQAEMKEARGCNPAAPVSSTSQGIAFLCRNKIHLDMKAEVKSLIDQFVANIPHGNTEEGRKESDRLLAEAMSLTETPEEKKEAGAYMREAMKNRNRKRTDLDTRAMLDDIRQAVSMAYIAEKYFGKSRAWMNQRINNTNVNGKPTAFTNEELKILADSLSDLSSRLSALSRSIHRSL